MAAKFYVVGSFLVRSRNLFVAVGDVVEGHIEAGMTVNVDLGNIAVSAKIASMEVIDVEYLNKSYKGLAFAYDDPQELGFWEALKLSDETLSVDPTS